MGGTGLLLLFIEAKKLFAREIKQTLMLNQETGINFHSAANYTPIVFADCFSCSHLLKRAMEMPSAISLATHSAKL